MSSQPSPSSWSTRERTRLFAVVQIRGRANFSGVETTMTFAAIYEIRAGRIARGREYTTRAEALKAAGLAE